MPTSLLIHRSVTTVLWGIVGMALLGSLAFSAFRVAMLIATMGMLCDSCNNHADLLRVLGAESVGRIIVVGAMVLIIWHVDPWPYRMAAPAILVLALAFAPKDTLYHWFWWLGA